MAMTSSGQKLQFDIATDIFWSRIKVIFGYWLLVVSNVNFIFLLTSSGQEWKLYMTTDI